MEQYLNIYFSPTCGGERVSRAILSALGGRSMELNLTHSSFCGESRLVDDSDIVVFTIPVYGGHMPKIAMTRFDKIRGKGDHPCVLVAVYGNRAFEKALTDLDAFVRERGFKPVAAAAFPCEHSYSSADTPIAYGRPDAEDLAAAEEFGRKIREKINSHSYSDIAINRLVDEPVQQSVYDNFTSFVKEYQTRQATSPCLYIPMADFDRCTGCGECISICPTDAINTDMTVDSSRCIKCCACVKVCPNKARSFHTPFAKMLSENFAARKSPIWIL